MKGKQAKAAEGRRGWADVERERDEANHRADRTATELESERVKVGRQLAALRNENEQLRIAAETAVTPAVTAMGESLAAAREERDKAVAKVAEIRGKWERAFTGMRDYLVATTSITAAEATETISRFVDPDGIGMRLLHDGRIVDLVKKGKLTHDQGLEIDRARHGNKRNEYPVHAAAALVDEELDEKVPSYNIYDDGTVE